MIIHSRALPQQAQLLWRFEKFRTINNRDAFQALADGTADDLGWTGEKRKQRIATLMGGFSLLTLQGQKLTRPLFLTYAYSVDSAGIIPPNLRPAAATEGFQTSI